MTQLTLQDRVTTLFRTADLAWLIPASSIDGAGPNRRATDLRWSADGRRLLVSIGDRPVMLTTVSEDRPAFHYVDNPAGTVRLDVPAGFELLSRKPTNHDVVSADFDASGGVVTVWRDGSVRRGPTRESPLILEIRDARWVRCAPAGKGLAIIESRDDGQFSQIHVLPSSDEPAVRWTVQDQPHLGGVAWSPDGERVAIGSHRKLLLANARGGEISTIPLDPPTGELVHSGRIAWSPHGIVAVAGGKVAVVSLDGVIRRLSLDAKIVGGISVTPDGRYAAILELGGKPGLAIVDLETGESGTVRWQHHFGGDCAVSFSANALAWSTHGGFFAIPWGETAGDPDRALLDGLYARWSRRDQLTNDDLVQMSAQLKTATFRPSTSTRAASFRNAIDDELKKRKRAAVVITKPAAEATFAVGDVATHTKFGEGAVTQVEGGGETAKVSVKFADAEKTLQAKFLKRG